MEAATILWESSVHTVDKHNSTKTLLLKPIPARHVQESKEGCSEKQSPSSENRYQPCASKLNGSSSKNTPQSFDRFA